LNPSVVVCSVVVVVISGVARIWYEGWHGFKRK